MEPEHVAGIVKSLTRGAVRACLNMTDEYQFPSKTTFDANGAWSLYHQKPAKFRGALCEKRLVRPDPNKRGTRYAYRLTPLGLAVRSALISALEKPCL